MSNKPYDFYLDPGEVTKNIEIIKEKCQTIVDLINTLPSGEEFSAAWTGSGATIVANQVEAIKTSTQYISDNVSSIESNFNQYIANARGVDQFINSNTFKSQQSGE